MHVSFSQVVAVIIAVAVTIAVGWLLFIAVRREKYTRERFAFAALAAFSGMVATVLASLADKETPWGAAINLFRELLGYQPTPDPPRVADHILMFLILCLVAAFALQLYDRWNGAVSTRHFEKQRFHEPATLVAEGWLEGRRIIGIDPPLELYQPSAQPYPDVVL